MDSLFDFLKYFGLIIATFSSLIGITNDFKKKGKDGVKVITGSGKTAIILTTVGLIISALSIYLQDRKDELKTNQQLIEENRRQFNELKRFHTQLNNLNEIRFQQNNLSKKQDSIQRVQEEARIQEQLTNNNYLFTQMIVDNYLQSIPEQVEIIIEIPFNIKQVSKILNYSNLRVFWASNYQERPRDAKYFCISGIIRTNPAIGTTFFVQAQGLGTKERFEFRSDASTEQYSEEDTFTSSKSIENEIKPLSNESIRLVEKNSSTTRLIIDLTYFNYANSPWGKLIDFRINNFTYELFKTGKFNFSNLNDGINKAYLRFDKKYMLRLYKHNWAGTRKDNMNRLWKEFRGDIYMKTK